MEALKHLTGTGTVLKNKLLIFDGTDMTFAPIIIRRRPDCPTCSDL
jgi:molybdopterin/thiamine biosynthesis adenylyltransferase